MPLRELILSSCVLSLPKLVLKVAVDAHVIHQEFEKYVTVIWHRSTHDEIGSLIDGPLYLSNFTITVSEKSGGSDTVVFINKAY